MRRTAILSDIHGNAVALHAVLAEVDADRIEHGVCLGDVVQGGPQPAACVDLLGEREWPVVLGNADAFVLDPATAEGSSEGVSERQLEVRAWSHAQLGPARRELVGAYSPTVTVDLGDGRPLLACHATPASYHPVVFPTASEDEFRAAFGGAREDVVACGHIHLPYLRRLGGTLVLNPGSVGLGYDHGADPEALRFDPWASWAVIGVGGGRLSIELRRTPFDPAAVAEAYRASGMPYGDDYAAAWLPG
jgi:predicted phosphodiesterase